MITLVEITASDWLDQAKPLMMEHWEEVAKQTGVPEPSIDREYLMSAEQQGLMFTVGVFADGVLVGYSINGIGETFNFADLCIMSNEGIFIRKQYRGIGKRLIEESERIGKARGATRAKWHTYKDSRADRVFAALGYHAYDVIYTKEL